MSSWARTRVSVSSAKVGSILGGGSILNPWSIGAELRSRHKAYPRPRQFLDKACANLNALLDFHDRMASRSIARDRLQIQLTSSVPTTSFIVSARSVIFTPLLTVLTGGRSPTIIFRRDGERRGMVDALLREFEEHWKTSTPVTRATLGTAKADADAATRKTAGRPACTNVKIENGLLVVK